MRKAVLFYNPHAGRKRGRRIADVEAAAAVLRTRGVETSIAETRGAERTAEQVRQLMAKGVDTVIACGGDGTIHDVLQGMVGTNAVLGVIPLGTANSFANDLGLPSSPSEAARFLLQAKPKRIVAGRITCKGFSGESISRYFTVTVGIGIDAEVFHNLSANQKSRLGHAAYYVEAFKLWLKHPLRSFSAKIDANDQSSHLQASQLLAVRIRNFGGLLRELAPGASLQRDDLRLVLFRTRSRTAYLSYAIRGALGGNWNVSGVDLIHAKHVICEPISEDSAPIFVEADGELLGTLPAEIYIVPDAFTLLMP